MIEMKNKVYTINIIKSKIVRPDFFMKLILCIFLQASQLYHALQLMNHYFPSSGTEKGNMLMYLLMVFTDPYIAYYSVLLAFAILVSDIVYEEYLTKNVYVMYGSRKKVYFGMLKLIGAFSLFFICLYLLLVVIIGVCGGLDVSFDFTDNAIRTWAKEQEFYVIRSTAIYLKL